MLIINIWGGYRAQGDYLPELVGISEELMHLPGIMGSLLWLESGIGFQAFDASWLASKFYYVLAGAMNVGVVSLWFGNVRIGKQLGKGLILLLLAGVMLSAMGKVLSLPDLQSIAYSYFITLVKVPVLPLLVLPLIHYLNYLQLSSQKQTA